MIEVWAVMTFCLVAAPDDCRRDRVRLYDATPLQCSMGGPQAQALAWSRALPGERVSRIECKSEYKL